MRGQRTWRRLGVLVAAMSLVAVTLAPSTAAGGHGRSGSPDTSVLDWNRYALEALINPVLPVPPAPPLPPGVRPGAGQVPTVSVLHLAIVQGAVYDAVKSIDHRDSSGGHKGHHRKASTSAAVATAAHHVLAGLSTASSPPPVRLLSDSTMLWLDEEYGESKADAIDKDGADAVAAGIVAGAAAAAAMLEKRKDDGRYGTFTFSPSVAIGKWRPTSGVIDPFGWVAKVDPFTLNRPTQFISQGPDRLNSGSYARDYNEVKTLGARTSQRNADQEAVADFFTVSPIEMVNRTFRTIADERNLSPDAQAKLFAMVNTATADSMITCWQDKEKWSFWRPITAIQQGDNDGNPRTVVDKAWLPLENTPPYPDHSSGYNCATSALMHSAKAFFGTDRIAFTLVKVEGQSDQRQYSRFTDVVKDTIDARVYQGLHFRKADVAGAKIGEDVARWVSRQYRR